MIRENKLNAFVERCLCDNRPITADIFLTNFCNLKCSYCRYKHKSGTYITFDNFVKYANRLLELGVKAFILTGGGEPTMNPDFYKITQWLENHSIPYGINTNLLKPLHCNANFIKVSIDTGIPINFQTKRGVNALDKVISNLIDLVNYKIKNNNSNRIGVQCVASCKEDVLSFYNIVKDIDVDYIYYRPLETIGDSKIDKTILLSWLGDIINDKRVNISFKFNLKNYKPKKCFANWSTITIDYNGNVPYCCHMPNAIVGNIMDDDILLKKKNYPVDMMKCEHPCRLSGANEYMENLKVESDIYFI